jgi:ketosteroid isomerase-like protein
MRRRAGLRATDPSALRDAPAPEPGSRPADVRVALQARSRRVLYDGQEYTNEYLFLVEFNDSGQIRHVREYFDMDRVRDILQPAVARWRELQDEKS